MAIRPLPNFEGFAQLYSYTSEIQLTGKSWARFFGVEIIDPDGWRNEKLDPTKDLINFIQFTELAQQSTRKFKKVEIMNVETGDFMDSLLELQKKDKV